MKKLSYDTPPAGPVQRIAGLVLGTIIIIVLAYACYKILGMFFGG